MTAVRGLSKGAIAAVLALIAGAATACGSPAAVPPPGDLAWAQCRSGQGPHGVQCASLQVPLDTASGVGPTITLTLDRIAARGRRIGSLVLNPGGPGVSAVDELPGLAAGLSASLRDHFDLIGYDPPGVGHSTPVTCFDNGQLGAYLHADPSPPGAAGFARVVATARSFADACRTGSGALLAHVSTVDAARDLDRVRAAVGDATLTYLGFSYGTLLGATYAGLYPSRVRALVLDGALDPTLDPIAMLEAQAKAVDAQFRTFAAACRASSCAWDGGADPTASFLSLLGRVRQMPLPAGGGRRAGPAELLYGTAEALYSPSEWSTLSQALGAAERGDGSGVTALFDRYVGRSTAGHYDTTVEAEAAVSCADTASPPLAAIAAAATAVRAAAPIFGPLDVDAESACAVWPAPASTGPHAISAAGSAPIMVVGSTGDPITPYPWAQHLAAQLGTGVLLTRVGDGHTAYSASSCVRTAVDAYLVALRPPAAGTRCASD